MRILPRIHEDYWKVSTDAKSDQRVQTRNCAGDGQTNIYEEEDKPWARLNCANTSLSSKVISWSETSQSVAIKVKYNWSLTNDQGK